jgi:type I restriction enzyme S subunit
MWQGASGVSKLEGIVSPAYTVLTPIGEQVSEFWGYLFKSNQTIQLFERFSQGLTSDTWNLKYPVLSKIRLRSPHPDEQKKIADFLFMLDTKVQITADKLCALEAFKKGLLQQMFV